LHERVDTSVVIPARNAAATLGEQLDAFVGQRVDVPWELIVVDNGSQDGTAAIAAAYRSKLPLRVVSAGDRPVANHARNVGIGLATGEHILLCDADDVVGPDWIRLMRTVLLEAELVGGPLESHPSNQSGRVPDPRNRFGGFLLRPFGANCGFRRSVWEALGGFDEAFPAGDDAEFFWRAQLAGYQLVWADGAIVSYRLRSTVSESFRKSYLKGRARPQLYRQFRRHGMPRSSVAAGLAEWARLVLTAPRLLAGAEKRDAWLGAAAWRVGCIAGSVRHRVLYL
jgi:glycosyltransferase involved in cell wall biosynthesis